MLTIIVGIALVSTGAHNDMGSYLIGFGTGMFIKGN
jgi:hypothetical protein